MVECMHQYHSLVLIDAGIAKKELMLLKVRELFEVNPMMGHRGVRLGVTYPEVYAIETRVVLETFLW